MTACIHRPHQSWHSAAGVNMPDAEAQLEAGFDCKVVDCVRPSICEHFANPTMRFLHPADCSTRLTGTWAGFNQTP